MEHLIKINGKDPLDCIVKGENNVAKGAKFIKTYLFEKNIDEKDAVVELRIAGEKEAKQLLIFYLAEFSYRETFFRLISKDITSWATFEITMKVTEN